MSVHFIDNERRRRFSYARALVACIRKPLHMSAMNAFYAQSGGVTAVINATACGVIETARKHSSKIANVYAGRNGIIGALTEDMIDTNRESAGTIAALRTMPGGAFGSARYKLRGLDENRAEYERLIEVFKAHNIGYFFYNGGNDAPGSGRDAAAPQKLRADPKNSRPLDIGVGIPATPIYRIADSS